MTGGRCACRKSSGSSRARTLVEVIERDPPAALLKTVLEHGGLSRPPHAGDQDHGILIAQHCEISRNFGVTQFIMLQQMQTLLSGSSESSVILLPARPSISIPVMSSQLGGVQFCF